jgi:metal-sulfur cluster biosynthetic enzyme
LEQGYRGGWSMTQPDVESVLLILNSIVDPCSLRSGVPAGLVDMGLVRDVRVQGGCGAPNTVSLRVGVTEPGCFMAAPFATEARERLLAVDNIDEVDIALIPWSDWSEEDLAPDYRRRLEAARAQRKMHGPLELSLRPPSSA